MVDRQEPEGGCSSQLYGELVLKVGGRPGLTPCVGGTTQSERAFGAGKACGLRRGEAGARREGDCRLRACREAFDGYFDAVDDSATRDCRNIEAAQFELPVILPGCCIQIV